VSLDKTSEKGEFIGQDQISAGTSFFAAGQVLQAYVTPGAICLLDEADHTRPDYVTTLHALLEKGSTFTVTSTGEVFKRAPGMVFIAAANTNGTGDMTGRYPGTSGLNSALSDRFAHFFRVSFLPEQQEIDLLFSRHGGALQAAVYPAGLDCYRDGSRAVTREDAARLVNVFTKCRAEVGGALVEPPSLRRAFAFMEALSDGLAPELAWEIAVVNPSPEDDGTKHEELRGLFALHWK
jgi:MoxR-like ATPase